MRDRGAPCAALQGRSSLAAPARGGRPRLERAFALNAAHRRRVSIAVYPQSLIDSFLGGYLRRVAGPHDEAYVVARGGPVIAGVGSTGTEDRSLDVDAAQGQIDRGRGEHVYASAPCRRPTCASCC